MVFLVECGKHYGLGHLHRSQVLALAMIEEGWKCCFGLSEEEMVPIVQSDGFIAVPWFNDGLDIGPADILVVDGYHYDVNLFHRWATKTKISLAFDDLGDRPISPSVVLNHNLYGDRLSYAKYDAGIVIGGAKYSLVRKKFFQIAKSSGQRSNRILVSFGGTDDGRYAVPVAKAILAGNSEVALDVALSDLQPSSEELEHLGEKYSSRMVVHRGVDMAEVMSHCAVLVGAAGLTALEAMAAGLEQIVCGTARNQRFNIEAFHNAGVVSFDEFEPYEMGMSAVALLDKGATSGESILDDRGPRRVIGVLSKIFWSAKNREKVNG